MPRARLLALVPLTLLFVPLLGCDRSAPHPTPTTAAPSNPAPSTSAETAPATSPESEPDDGPATRANWKPISVEQMHPATVAQRDKGLAAQKALAIELVTALTESIEARGAAESVEFCRGAAPDVTQAVGAKFGVAVGRTSHKLRNPSNHPPEWADKMVADRTDTQTFVLGPEGELGILSPIRLSEMCTKCHGASEALAPEVNTAVARLYPEDEATGFAAGDLRGWFWVEVPPPS